MQRSNKSIPQAVKRTSWKAPDLHVEFSRHCGILTEENMKLLSKPYPPELMERLIKKVAVLKAIEESKKSRIFDSFDYPEVDLSLSEYQNDYQYRNEE